MIEKLGGWFASLLAPARAGASRPIDIWPDTAAYHGPGITRQASHSTLLAENTGIPDAATRAIANRISSLDLEVYVERRVTGGTTEEETLDDHALKLLLDHPHPNLTIAQMLRLTGQYIVTVGEAYWIKVGNALGVPRELHVVPPGMVAPLVRSNVVRGYEVQDANGRVSVYPPDNFVRFYFPDPEDPWRSEGYLGPSGITADTHKFAGQHLRSHYQHDATPKVVLEAQEGADEWGREEKLAFWQHWKERFSTRGGSHAGLPAITPTNFKLVEMAMQSGADMTPLLEYLREDLLLSFGTPRPVLGQVVSGDRSSAEVQQWIFDRFTITPIANLIEDALTHQLAPDFDPKIRVRFCPFVSEDKEYTLKQEQQDLTLKVRSINNVRTDRMLDPVPWGEEPVGTKNDVPYDPEDARERANQPPALPGSGAPGEKKPDAEIEDEDAERIAHIRLRQEFRARRRKRQEAA